MIYDSYLDRHGCTPLARIDIPEFSSLSIYAKLEGTNPTGSLKDRGAAYVIGKLLKEGRIDRNSTLVESSSGNFGIALAAVCQRLKLRFICVIDPNITRTNEMLIRSFGAEVVKVEQPDPQGGYLLNRIKTVKSLVASNPNAYWVNQYGNPLVREAYAETLGTELWNEIPDVDLVFLGVSSGGTIAGLTSKNQERGGRTTIIPVDTEGSTIFGGPPKRRYIPGIGSSMVPQHFSHMRLETPVIVREIDAVAGCRELLTHHGLFVGGSSGSVYHAAKQYLSSRSMSKGKVVLIFADLGDRYADTIFNDDWSLKLKQAEVCLT